MSRLPVGSLILSVAVGFACALPAQAAAGTQDGTVVALHAAPHIADVAPCERGEGLIQAGLSCSGFQTSWPLNTPCDLYLVLARGTAPPGLAGLSYGVLYNNGETGEETRSDGQGVDVFDFTLCASGLEFPNSVYQPEPDRDYESSGCGNRITWNATEDCQSINPGSDGVHALAGVFYVMAYTDDIFEITPNYKLLSGPEFWVGDCNNTLTDLPYPEAAGAVAFGSGTGRNPCLPSPVETTTWSRLKTRYRGTP